MDRKPLLVYDGDCGLPRSWASAFRAQESAGSRWKTAGLAALAAVVLLVNGAGLAGTFGWRAGPTMPILRIEEPFRTINNYGLFAVMTTVRNEIVLEGSPDGKNWQAYEFKWKPGDVKRRPTFVAPHQPRLDWQMWFAVLGSYQQNQWVINLMARLLQGSPPVLALLKSNPFPDAPPRYMRAVVYEYHFTDFAQRRADDAWWRREPRGMYAPIVGFSAKQ